MIVKIERKTKIELLEAIKEGQLDTAKCPNLTKALRDNKVDFIDYLLKENIVDSIPIEVEVIDRREQVDHDLLKPR